MKGERGGVAIKEFVECIQCIHAKMYSFLVDDSSEHKKEKCMNKKMFLIDVKRKKCVIKLLEKMVEC